MSYPVAECSSHELLWPFMHATRQTLYLVIPQQCVGLTVYFHSSSYTCIKFRQISRHWSVACMLFISKQLTKIQYKILKWGKCNIFYMIVIVYKRASNCPSLRGRLGNKLRSKFTWMHFSTFLLKVFSIPMRCYPIPIHLNFLLLLWTCVLCKLWQCHTIIFQTLP